MNRAADKLERLRRFARDLGIPLDSADRIAISIPRAARMLDLNPRLLRKLLREDGIPIIQFGGSDRVDVIDLVEFVSAHKVIQTSTRSRTSPRVISSDLAAKLDKMTRNAG